MRNTNPDTCSRLAKLIMLAGATLCMYAAFTQPFEYPDGNLTPNESEASE